MLCMHIIIGYVPREIPPFWALNFRSGAYQSFSQINKKISSGALLIDHQCTSLVFTFFGGFYLSGDHHFQNFFNFNPFIASHGRLSLCIRQRRGLAASQSSSQTRPGSSGDSHFHAKNGSSSFRSPAFSSSFRSSAFSRSTGSSFWSSAPFFTLPRHMPSRLVTYQNLGWLSPPPPPNRAYSTNYWPWMMMACQRHQCHHGPLLWVGFII